MNTNQIKLQKTSKVVSILTKIIYIALIVAMCMEVIAIAWIGISPDSNSFMIGSVTIASPISKDGHTNGEVVAELSSNLVNQVLLFAIFVIAHQIFKDISHEHTPFNIKHVKRIKTISILTLISSIITPTIEMALTKIFAPAVEASSEINFGFIAIAIMFYCLALIFEYGTILQTQSDETL